MKSMSAGSTPIANAWGTGADGERLFTIVSVSQMHAGGQHVRRLETQHCADRFQMLGTENYSVTTPPSRAERYAASMTACTISASSAECVSDPHRNCPDESNHGAADSSLAVGVGSATALIAEVSGSRQGRVWPLRKKVSSVLRQMPARRGDGRFNEVLSLKVAPLASRGRGIPWSDTLARNRVSIGRGHRARFYAAVRL